MTTINMLISLPTVSVTSGPTYATMLNSAFDTVDAHDHTTGKGIQVPTAGININAALEFNDYGVTELGSVAFTAGSAPSVNKAVYVNASNDLYYKNASGTSVQLTSGGSINSVGSGIISYVTPGAYPYSVTSGNAQQVIGVSTASARTLNLPSAATAMAFWVKDITGSAATNNISIVPNGADTIDTVAATLTINEDSAARMIVSDGATSWYVL